MAFVVPLNCMFVTNMALQLFVRRTSGLTARDLLEYFSRFGPVKLIDMPEKLGRNSAFVTFCNAESAASALLCTMHSILRDNTVFTVSCWKGSLPCLSCANHSCPYQCLPFLAFVLWINEIIQVEVEKAKKQPCNSLLVSD